MLIESILAVAALQAMAVSGSGTVAVQPLPACEQLVGVTVPAARIGIESGAARVDAATLESAHGDPHPVCVVHGRIGPLDADAPPIHFQINLPSVWNGKAVHVGGGGYNGVLVSARNPSFLPADGEPVRRGYATFGSDSGHRGGGGDPMRSMADASFALNDEAFLNYGHAQLKKVRDVAGQLIVRHYGRVPERVYFYGNSQGGHEGLLVAQRFAQDYDGVVAIHPAYNFTALQLGGLEASKALYASPEAWLSPGKTHAIGQAVVAACDLLDGIEDGIVSNVGGCRKAFDVHALRCDGGADAGDQCLSDAQIRTVQTLALPTRFAFEISGSDTFAGWPVLDGAFSGMTFFGLGRRPVPGRPPTIEDSFVFVMADQAVRYMFTGDPQFDSLAFDPRDHRQAIERVGAIVDGSDPNLDAFRQRGAKLLLMHGTVDLAIPYGNTVAYHQRLQERYGDALGDFVRLYIAPGFGHGDGAFPLNWDSMATLERWVEDGVSPPPQVVTEAVRDGRAPRARPLCEWPSWPKYTGGDASASAAFDCVQE